MVHSLPRPVPEIKSKTRGGGLFRDEAEADADLVAGRGPEVGAEAEGEDESPEIPSSRMFLPAIGRATAPPVEQDGVAVMLVPDLEKPPRPP